MQAVLRTGRRDALIVQLAGQLADAREQNGVLLERLRWFEAAMPDMPSLKLADGRTGSRQYGQAPRRSAARLTSI
jgi:hypothetical protein